MSDPSQSVLASVMKVPAICILMLMNIFALLSTQPAQSYSVKKSAFPIIYPDRLQFFEHESVRLNCGRDKGMDVWRVMRKPNKISPENVSDVCPAPTCTIDFTFERHSGEYWCENHEGVRSRSLNITVTDGPVILNFSAQPVKEGSDVILHCIIKNTERAHISDFYKNDIYLGTYFEPYMTLSNVSKSDEGLYMCTFSHAGESPESWLAVVKSQQEEGSDEETQPPTLTIWLCTIFTLLFLFIGLILYKRYKALENETVTFPKDITCAMFKIPRKRNGSKVSAVTTEQAVSEQQTVMYSVITLDRGN